MSSTSVLDFLALPNYAGAHTHTYIQREWETNRQTDTQTRRLDRSRMIVGDRKNSCDKNVYVNYFYEQSSCIVSRIFTFIINRSYCLFNDEAKLRPQYMNITLVSIASSWFCYAKALVSGFFAPRYFRSSERKFPVGTFAPRNESSRELSLLGTNVPGNFRSREQMFPRELSFLV